MVINNETKYNTIQYSMVQHNATQHNAIQYSTTQHNATRYSKEEKKTIISFRKENLGWKEIAKRCNSIYHNNQPIRNRFTVRNKYVKIIKKINKGTNKEINKKRNILIPLFIDKKTPEKIDWREWFDNLEARQAFHQKTSSSQDEATIKIDTGKKVAICFSADWHLGSSSISYDELKYNLQIILDTDRIYIVTVGDLIDNFRSFRSLQPILSQITSPRDQGTILQAILNEFLEKKKWLAACWGNHDVERDEKMYGESPIKNLLSKNLVYFNGKGTLNLCVGEQKYIIRMSHYFKGYSIYNPNHSMNRELKWFAPFADVIVGAHKHQPAVQTFHAYGQRKVLIQVGTFQTDDGYAKRFWQKGVIGVPVVVFRPDRHEVFAYPSLNELLEGF